MKRAMENIKHYAHCLIHALAYGDHIFRSSNWDTKKILFGVWATFRCEKQPKDCVCVCVCECVCVCVCMYAYTHTYIRLYIYIMIV